MTDTLNPGATAPVNDLADRRRRRCVTCGTETVVSRWCSDACWDEAFDHHDDPWDAA